MWTRKVPPSFGAGRRAWQSAAGFAASAGFGGGSGPPRRLARLAPVRPAAAARLAVGRFRGLGGLRGRGLLAAGAQQRHPEAGEPGQPERLAARQVVDQNGRPRPDGTVVSTVGHRTPSFIGEDRLHYVGRPGQMVASASVLSLASESGLTSALVCKVCPWQRSRARSPPLRRLIRALGGVERSCWGVASLICSRIQARAFCARSGAMLAASTQRRRPRSASRSACCQASSARRIAVWMPHRTRYRSGSTAAGAALADVGAAEHGLGTLDRLDDVEHGDVDGGPGQPIAAGRAGRRRETPVRVSACSCLSR